MGIIRSLPETRAMLLTDVLEVYDVARASGIGVQEKAIDTACCIACIFKQPYTCG